MVGCKFLPGVRSRVRRQLERIPVLQAREQSPVGPQGSSPRCRHRAYPLPESPRD